MQFKNNNAAVEKLAGKINAHIIPIGSKRYFITALNSTNCSCFVVKTLEIYYSNMDFAMADV